MLPYARATFVFGQSLDNSSQNEYGHLSWKREKQCRKVRTCVLKMNIITLDQKYEI